MHAPTRPRHAYSSNDTILAQLRQQIYAHTSLVTTDAWLTTFVQTTRLPITNPDFTTMALTNLLHTDLRQSISQPTSLDTSQLLTSVLPLRVSDVTIKQVALQCDVTVQVLDIQDTSVSLYNQVEQIERVERGEEIRGREIVRTIPSIHEQDDNESETASTAQLSAGAGGSTGVSTTRSSYASLPSTSKHGSNGPHKLLVQDAQGTQVMAFELERVPKITVVTADPPLRGRTIDSDSSTVLPANNRSSFGTDGTTKRVEGISVGAKLLLKKGLVLRRGVAMLTPAVCEVLGGRVEEWDKPWRDGRKRRLKEQLDGSDT